MIVTLLITIFVESAVLLGYSHWRRKPGVPLLLTAFCVNLITQSFLWIGLNLLFAHYLIVLLIAEVLIGIMEGILLFSIPVNQLQFQESMLLSLCMNLVSFTVGLFLPA